MSTGFRPRKTVRIYPTEDGPSVEVDISSGIIPEQSDPNPIVREEDLPPTDPLASSVETLVNVLTVLKRLEEEIEEIKKDIINILS